MGDSKNSKKIICCYTCNFDLPMPIPSFMLNFFGTTMRLHCNFIFLVQILFSIPCPRIVSLL